MNNTPTYKNRTDVRIDLDTGQHINIHNVSSVHMIAIDWHGNRNIIGSYGKEQRQFFYDPYIPNKTLTISNNKVSLDFGSEDIIFSKTGTYKIYVKIEYHDKKIVTSDPCKLDVI